MKFILFLLLHFPSKNVTRHSCPTWEHQSCPRQYCHLPVSWSCQLSVTSLATLLSLPAFSDWRNFHFPFPLQQGLLLVRCCRCLKRFIRVRCQKPNSSWTFSSWPQQQAMGALLQSSQESREPKTSLIKLLSFYSHHCMQLQDNALGLLIFFPPSMFFFL